MSTLIISNNLEQAKNHIHINIEKVEGCSINIFNNQDIIHFWEDDKDLSTQDIRNIIKHSNHKPSHLKSKYIFLSNFNRSNHHVQNAFLKTLEEGSAKIYLHAQNEMGLLDTIISRVNTVYLKKNIEENLKLMKDLDRIIKNKEISKITNLSKKHNIEEILKNLELYIQREGLQPPRELYKFKRRNFETNLNEELQLYNLLLKLVS